MIYMKKKTKEKPLLYDIKLYYKHPTSVPKQYCFK